MPFLKRFWVWFVIGLLAVTTFTTLVLGRLDAPAHAIAQSSEVAIVRQVVQQLGRSNRFSVRKVAVSGSYALVSWNEGEAGGQALLKKQSHRWTLLTHGGGWLGLRGLTSNGVPRSSAEQLLNQLDPNWHKYE
ncbi:MAG: hypothetical protein KME45_32275 [Stenomitos rutilans HA7619-LM2]|jgi:hypothetical protein|nr:hypothetical protein [Stenomitos rutilans HA7619-LM2]